MKNRKPMTNQDRRDYQKKYYRAHREKAKAYQREYTKKHKRRGVPKGQFPDQGIPKRCLSLSDLTKAPTRRFERQLKAILSETMFFTM